MATIQEALDQRDSSVKASDPKPIPSAVPDYSVLRECPELGDLMCVFIEDGERYTRVTFTVDAVYEQIDPATGKVMPNTPIRINVPIGSGLRRLVTFNRAGDRIRAGVSMREDNVFFADWVPFVRTEGKRVLAFHPPELEWSPEMNRFVKKETAKTEPPKAEPVKTEKK